MTTEDQQRIARAERQLAVIQQNGAAGQAAMTQLQGQESAMLNQQAQAGQDQLNAQGAEQTAAFNQQEYNSDTQTQAQVRYLSDQQCIQWYDAAHTRCETTAPN